MTLIPTFPGRQAAQGLPCQVLGLKPAPLGAVRG